MTLERALEIMRLVVEGRMPSLDQVTEALEMARARILYSDELELELRAAKQKLREREDSHTRVRVLLRRAAGAIQDMIAGCAPLPGVQDEIAKEIDRGAA